MVIVSRAPFLAQLVDHQEYTDEEINNFNGDDRCRLIQSDCVTCARHFDYQVNQFLTNFLFSSAEPLRSSSCIVCNASLKEISKEEDEITCDKCGMTTLASACDTKVVAQLVVKTADKKILKFTSFNDGIQSVLDLNNCQVSLNEIDIADLRKKIFDSGVMKMIIDKANQVTAQFLPEHD